MSSLYATKQRVRALFIFAAVFFILSILSGWVAGSLRAPQEKIYLKPTPQVLAQVEKQKKALWVEVEGLLLVSKESREGAKLSSTTKDAQLQHLVEKDVAIENVPYLAQVYPTPAATRLNQAGVVGLTVGIVLSCLGGWAHFKRAEIEAQERLGDQQQQLATTGGAGGPVEIDYDTPDTTFDDVAGCEEAVESLREMAEFLQHPERYQKMGVRMPKGAILSGSPGGGKTLLARALAGEAKVPFYTAAGSEFTEIYVGAGAKRVRELFKKMREQDKAILFIDEIDAVARKRSAEGQQGNQEAEATLNQLLTEIDGFNSKHDGKAIMVLAATNRVDLLDPALTRSGRLERRIEVPQPDRRGRERILRLHARNKPLHPQADLALIAARTPGFSGADMATILNEAGLLAVREEAEAITQAHLDQAVANVAMGSARKSALVTEHDRRVTAWHEAGHTLCAFLQPHHDDPVAVSITPRGPAGGVTWMSGSDDIFLTRQKALSQLVTAFGGRVAEELLLDGEYTQGASGDFQAATDLAYQMVTRYGMTEVGFQVRPEQVAVSNEKVTAQVEELLREAHDKAHALITENSVFLARLVDRLLQQDDVYYREIEELALELGIPHTRTMTFLPPEEPAIIETQEKREAEGVARLGGRAQEGAEKDVSVEVLDRAGDMLAT